MDEALLREEAITLERELSDVYESDPKRKETSNRLIAIGEELNDRRIIGIGYCHLSVFYFATRKEYGLFREAAEKCVEYLRDTEEYLYLTSNYLLMGLDAINYGQITLNFDYFLMARHYSDQTDDIYLKALVNYDLCGFYLVIGDLKKALACGLAAVAGALEYKGEESFFGSDLIDLSHCMLGQCYIEMGEFEKALECYEVSVEREKYYTPRYDCPNTALIYAFHIRALHVSYQREKRNQNCDAFIELMQKHEPSPPFFYHILATCGFLIQVGELNYAKKFLKMLAETNQELGITNFSVGIDEMRIQIAQKENNSEEYHKALEEYFAHCMENKVILSENMQMSVNLRLEMEQVQEEVQIKQNEVEIAKRSSEAKSQFLSNVSHEIRTPLNAILGMDEIIMRETTDDEIYQYANDIKSAGNTLLGLINDVLDSSKLEAGKIDIIPVEYDITSVLNDLSNMIRQRAENKGLEFEIDADPNVPFLLYGDEIRVKQCVLNILTNAVKYTEKGKVTLSVKSRKTTPKDLEGLCTKTFKKADGQKVDLGENAGSTVGACPIVLSFSVKDTGIGIKEEDLEKLYSRFERIEEKRNRTIEGTGLGMNIVQGLLDLMASHLEVKSEYGKGSEFSFELVQGARSCEVLGDYSKRLKELSSVRTEYQSLLISPDAKVLIVDDTPANLTVVKGLLKPTKIQVDTATSGKETLEMVKKKAYDLLFIDQRMPEMDGVETLHALKVLEKNLSKDAPCIALTANAISGAREYFLSEGFDDYLTKPIDSKKLEKTILRHLPKELVVDASDTDTLTDLKSEDLSELAPIEGIDYKEGYANCGNSMDILKDTMKDFSLSAKEQPDKILGFLEENDIKNYTILVHGLKSAARFIGATELSKMAEALEKAGDENNLQVIENETPKLLELYRFIGREIADVLKLENDIDFSNPSKTLIEDGNLKEIYGGILEFVSAMDFQTAGQVFDMIKEYRLPDEEIPKAKKIYELIREVNHDEIVKLLSE